MVKVLISDKLSPAAVDIFRSRGIEVDLKTGLSPADLRAIIGDYDGLGDVMKHRQRQALRYVSPPARGGVALLFLICKMHFLWSFVKSTVIFQAIAKFSLPQ